MRGVKPFVGIKNDDVISKIELGERLPLPPDAPAPLFSLMNRCWSYDPDNRPDFMLVEATIANIVEEERLLVAHTSRRVLPPPDIAPQKPPYRPHSSLAVMQVCRHTLSLSLSLSHTHSLYVVTLSLSQVKRSSSGGISDDESTTNRLSGTIDDVS